tara:strand:+ start:291 stop:449 length:159 start_codon:yes stop_codon:yes gene_type:complete
LEPEEKKELKDLVGLNDSKVSFHQFHRKKQLLKRRRIIFVKLRYTINYKYII